MSTIGKIFKKVYKKNLLFPLIMKKIKMLRVQNRTQKKPPAYLVSKASKLWVSINNSIIKIHFFNDFVSSLYEVIYYVLSLRYNETLII